MAGLFFDSALQNSERWYASRSNLLFAPAPAICASG